VGWLPRIDRFVGRFNRWFGSTAAASSGLKGLQGNPEVDTMMLRKTL
jgi:hypothetical protein